MSKLHSQKTQNHKIQNQISLKNEDGIAALESIISELQKSSPNPVLIKSILKQYSIPYDPNPIKLINTLLVFLESSGEPEDKLGRQKINRHISSPL